MKFEVDKHTLNDLEIFDSAKNSKSIFKLFNFTQCLGGRNRLYKLLSSPLCDIEKINERKEVIEYFQKNPSNRLHIEKNSLDFTEYYLRHARLAIKRPTKFGAWERKLMDKISPGEEYYLIERGVSSTVDLLQSIYNFSIKFEIKETQEKFPKLLKEKSKGIIKLFTLEEFKDIPKLKKIKAYDTANLDYIFRYLKKDDIWNILDLIYEYDALVAIAIATEKYKLSYPKLVDKNENCLQIKGLFHPFVENCVANDIQFDKNANLLFISGPNMAGKSTFLKALGVAVYLAHTGFPVPAEEMHISQLSGLCTTINISDDLSSGYSHFYAEVMRVKHVVQQLKENNNMFVVFDELFRGTNVKDAYDGTLSIASALSKIRTSFFVISSHIVEVANELGKNNNIQFNYFDIREENGQALYTYKLKEGVSDIRLGMYIIKKEGLIELINDINKN